MSHTEAPLWWDKDVDRAGRSIRPDVRDAAHRMWGCVWRRTQFLLSDYGQAAELMETTVAQVSRYLDREQVMLFSRGTDRLLMLAFQRSLYRHAAKLRRVEFLGGTAELSTRAVDLTWPRYVHARLELDQVVRSLSERSRTILALRYAGYTWKESVHFLGGSVSGLRSAFWRDVARVKGKLKTDNLGPPECPARSGITVSNDPLR